MKYGKDLASRVEELEDEVYFLNEGKRRKAKRAETLSELSSIWLLMLIPTFSIVIISELVANLGIRLLMIMFIVTLSGFACYKIGVIDGVEKCNGEGEVE